jgi:cytidylate kinase
MDSSHEKRLLTIATAVRASVPSLPGQDPGQQVTPAAAGTAPGAVRFVTISRQAGAGGLSLATELVNAINRLSPDAQPHPEPWCAWDHDLVDKVAAEHRIPNQFIEAMEDANHRWFSEFLASLSTSCDPSEFKVYRRVAMTIRALAQAGRAIIVGRGGVFITQGMPGGLHLRLVGPVQFRIGQMADRLHVSLREAAAKVHEIDRNRATFYRQHWPSKNVGPETFALTLNTAQLTEPQMVACLVPLIVGEQIAHTQASRQFQNEESPTATRPPVVVAAHGALPARH